MLNVVFWYKLQLSISTQTASLIQVLPPETIVAHFFMVGAAETYPRANS